MAEHVKLKDAAAVVGKAREHSVEVNYVETRVVRLDQSE